MTVAASRMPDLVERAEMEAAAEQLQAEIGHARAAVAAAGEARDDAAARLHRAYHGVLRIRTKEFIAATAELLRAEGRLKRLEART